MWRLFCPHRFSRIERRPLHGVQVVHFVCNACGRAKPAMTRTPDEHREMVAAGRVIPSKATRVTSGNVVQMKGRR